MIRSNCFSTLCCGELRRGCHRRKEHLAGSEGVAAPSTSQLTTFLLLLVFSSVSLAQNVTAKLTSREALVGETIELTVAVTNARADSTPQIPDVDGLTIRGLGSRTHYDMGTRRGRRYSRATKTWRYSVVPRREGEFIIPAIEIPIDGEAQTTSPMKLVVTKSETKDLLFVEIEDGSPQPADAGRRAYVGQAVKLQLKIWLRPYTDRRASVKLTAQQMFERIAETTSWGVFQEAIDQLPQGRGEVKVRESLREDTEGTSRAYYLYEVTSTVYPKRPGKIEVGEVQLNVDYPTAIEVTRRRSMFSFGPRVKIETRPISEKAFAPPIEIRDVPLEGRPATYRGAVGQYRFDVQAKPTNVAAGDPITLQIGLQGDGPMELVEAPPLSLVETLTRDFKITDDSLAGFVQDDAKLFSTTLRPLRDDVAAIPPIPFSFFNPKTEEFETVYSQTIPIRVRAAERLSLDEIVGGRDSNRSKQSPQDTPQEEQKSSEQVALKPYGVEQVLTGATPRTNMIPWLALCFPPCVVGLIWLARDGKSMLRRLRPTASGPRAAVQAVRKAESHSQLLDAINAYRDQDAIETLAQSCERSAYSPLDEDPLEELKQAALLELRRVEVTRSHVTGSHAVPAALLLSLMLFGGEDFTRSARADGPISLSVGQRRTLLEEANTLAQVTSNQDEVVRKERIEAALAKYKLVSDSGFASAELFFNMGVGSLHLEHFGEAVAYFEQAHRLAPADWKTAKNLRFARAKLDASMKSPSFWSLLVELNSSIQNIVRWALMLCWCLLWIVVGLRLFQVAIPYFNAWRNLLLAISALCLISLLWSAQYRSSFDAIVVQDETELRQGDGEVFGSVGPLVAGQRVKLLDERGSWLKLRATDATGWIRSEAVRRFD